MDALIHRLSAWDGLALTVREWRDPETDAEAGREAAPPLLCLPGLVRTGEDFAGVAARHGHGRRVVALNYAGRGASARARDVARYGPEACLRDAMDACAALGLAHVVAVGTSFGGLLAMGLAAARPLLLRGVVLNDIGPEIGTAGQDFVQRFVAHDPSLADMDAAAAYLRERLPALSLETADEWRAMAALTFAEGADGRLHPNWDTRIARLAGALPPDLWPLFGALAHVPVLLVHGEASDILLPATVAKMLALRPDMAVASLPGVGHAPTLAEPAAEAALADFLAAIG
ncbi:MAG: alpha/beta fold hydrolase [Proteobacteria bacterium]|nr:alpha/beta fold hydrolase [Pseudomonadota bacterium]